MLNLTLHKKKNFRIKKICEKDRKDYVFVSFRKFPFHGNIIFSELSFKRKCKKAASFRFCTCAFLRKYEIFVIAIHKVEFFCRSYCNENKRFFASPKVNFLLMLVKQKDEIFYAVPKYKQAIGKLFVEENVGKVIKKLRIFFTLSQ